MKSSSNKKAGGGKAAGMNAVKRNAVLGAGEIQSREISTCGTRDVVTHITRILRESTLQTAPEKAMLLGRQKVNGLTGGG